MLQLPRYAAAPYPASGYQHALYSEARRSTQLHYSAARTSEEKKSKRKYRSDRPSLRVLPRDCRFQANAISLMLLCQSPLRSCAAVPLLRAGLSSIAVAVKKAPGTGRVGRVHLLCTEAEPANHLAR